MLHAFVRFLCRLFFRLRITGLEKLGLKGPAILMPNHVSLLDAVFLAAHLPPEVVFVVNTDIARNITAFLRFFNHVTVDPLNPYSVRTMVKAVQGGKPLVLFPEGRVSTTGGLMKVFPGVGYIALKTGARLYPIAINGLERSKFSYIKDKLKCVLFPKVTIDIGKPITLGLKTAEPLRIQKERAAETILRAMQEQLLISRLRPGVNLFNELREQAKRSGGGFPVCGDLSQTLTYRKLIIASYVFARKLAPLLTGQERAGLMLPNAAGQTIALFALFRLGRTPAMLNYSAGIQSLTDACETASLQTVITSRLFVEKAKLESVVDALSASCRMIYLEDVRSDVNGRDRMAGIWDWLRRRPAERGPEEVILFTSGSESKPKGVVLTHDNLVANIQQARSVFDFTEKDTIFNAMPMFHSFGLTAGTLLPLLTGVKLFLYPSPLHYKVIPELVYDRNATILFGTSTFLAAYGRTAHPYDFYSVRYVVAGAEKLKEEVLQLWSTKFGLRIFEGYGTTEASPILSINTPLSYKKGTVGKLLPGVSWRIQPVEGIDTGGSLHVKGPNLMKGYLIHGKGFVPSDEWYDCGDVVSVDEQGYMSIQSRLKRFAKIGGEMVSLQLVEELAQKAIGAYPFAAVSVADGRKGERIILYTTSHDAALAPMKQYVSEQKYSPLLLPARLVHIHQLPLLGSGKTDYVSLRKMSESLPV